MDYLEEKNIPVIMFAWGQNVEQYHDETEEMVPGYYKQFSHNLCRRPLITYKNSAIRQA